MTVTPWDEERVLPTDRDVSAETREFIATQIRTRRQELGWTQGDLAQRVSRGAQSRVSKWENCMVKVALP